MSVLLIDLVSSFLSTYILLYLLSVGVGTFFMGWHSGISHSVLAFAFLLYHDIQLGRSTSFSLKYQHQFFDAWFFVTSAFVM
jgi:hypothetical protein